jgi:class 3 adenylate cyclase
MTVQETTIPDTSAKEVSPYPAVREYLRQADERLVFRALPHQVADALGLEVRPTLESLVEAMFDGDAALHWELVCPTCGARGEQHDWIRHARSQVTCKNCQSTFAVHLDQEAQATFSPHPRLRELGPEADDREIQRRLREQYPPTTVQELLTIQSFGDWARDQPLPEGEHLEVSRVVVWFSDLAGSTALYEKTGDPRGYDLVRDHFDLLFDAIHRYEGAVVKTTGDGVMAIFLSSLCALDAALVAHQTLEEFNRDRGFPENERLSLKVGIHAGPAIAVTLNNRLDYFGASVNLASRLDGLANGGEIVLTEQVFNEAGIQELATACTVEPIHTSVRGLSQPLTAYRLSITKADLPWPG